MRIVFTTQAGSGHWRPLIPLAQAAQTAGHEVAFATTPVACTALMELGFVCFPVGIDDSLLNLGSRSAGPHDPATPAAAVWVDVFVNVRARHAGDDPGCGPNDAQ
jgi:hypothetical protein